MHAHVPKIILDSTWVFVACHEESGDLLMCSNEQSCRNIVSQRNFDICTIEPLMKKESVSENHRLLVINLYLSQKS